MMILAGFVCGLTVITPIWVAGWLFTDGFLSSLAGGPDKIEKPWVRLLMPFIWPATIGVVLGCELRKHWASEV